MTSFRESEPSLKECTRTHRPPSRALVVLLLLAASAIALSFAGEATKRGRKMDITWREPDGTLKEVHAREIRYVYWTRSHLSKPRNGKTYKDSTTREEGIPLKGNYLPFDQCDRIDFQWSETEDEKPALRIHFKKYRGDVLLGAGNELAGADHPTAPYLQFTVDGKEHKIDMLPVSPKSAREGKPVLLSMVCTL